MISCEHVNRHHWHLNSKLGILVVRICYLASAQLIDLSTMTLLDVHDSLNHIVEHDGNTLIARYREYHPSQTVTSTIVIN
jgi:hypothetical protein